MLNISMTAVRRRWRDEEGLTLVEVLIAGFILTVGVLGLASVASSSVMHVRDARERDRSTAAASSAMEAVRALTYDQLSMRTGGGWDTDPLVAADGTGFVFDHDGDGAITERIEHTPSGSIHPYRCTSATASCWFDFPSGALGEVATFVTWHPDAVNPRGKLITVVASWQEPGMSAPRTVRLTTVVSPASQGLPAPAFEVLPKQLSRSVDNSAVNELIADPAAEECFQHTLSNFGDTDAYDVTFDAGWSVLNAGEGTWQHESWIVRVWFVTGTLVKGDPGTLMVDGGGDPQFYPDSPSGLDTGEAATLHFCYRPRPGDGDGTKPVATQAFTFTQSVRSKFDSNVIQTVRHTMNVLQDPYRLYLQDAPGGLVSHVRAWKSRSSGIFNFQQFPMTFCQTLSPTASPAGCYPPTASGPPDYDVGLDLNGDTVSDHPLDPSLRPGLWLPVNDVTLDGTVHGPHQVAAEWDYQFPNSVGSTTFTGDAVLRFWSWTHASEGTPPSKARVCPRVELIRIKKNSQGKPISQDVVGQVTASLDPGTNWVLRDVNIPWEPSGPGTGAGPVTFDGGEWLRLRMWNGGTVLASGTDCGSFHTGYGVNGSSEQFVARLDAFRPS